MRNIDHGHTGGLGCARLGIEYRAIVDEHEVLAVVDHDVLLFTGCGRVSHVEVSDGSNAISSLTFIQYVDIRGRPGRYDRRAGSLG